MRMVLLLAVVIFLLWRGWRVFTVPKAPTQLPGAPTTMLACRFCGIHVPANEAIRSTEGVFCCQQHRLNMHRE